MTAGTSTLVMKKPSKTVTPNGQTLNNYEVANNTTLGGDLSLNGYLKIDSGKTLDATNRTLNVAGDFNNAGGTTTFHWFDSQFDGCRQLERECARLNYI